ncbi:MAG: nuclear transport factor 2 family protein [Myxococcota bacterium]
MSDKAEARHEISKLIYAYSEALDGGDLARVGEILQHAAILVPANGIEARGREAIQKMFEEYTIFYDAEGPADPYAEGTHPHTCHFVANLVIEVDDDLRHAHSRSYVIVFQARPGFDLQPIFRNRYHDKFECVDGAWRFVERAEILDEHQGDIRHHLFQTPRTI